MVGNGNVQAALVFNLTVHLVIFWWMDKGDHSGRLLLLALFHLHKIRGGKLEYAGGQTRDVYVNVPGPDRQEGLSLPN